MAPVVARWDLQTTAGCVVCPIHTAVAMGTLLEQLQVLRADPPGQPSHGSFLSCYQLPGKGSPGTGLPAGVQPLKLFEVVFFLTSYAQVLIKIRLVSLTSLGALNVKTVPI